MNQLSSYIRSIPDFPKKGIVFRDITTLLKNPEALKNSVDLLHDRYANLKIEKVVCIESRGFILGSALAVSLGAGFVPIRKKGKLPGEVLSEQYSLNTEQMLSKYIEMLSNPENEYCSTTICSQRGGRW